MPTVNPQQLADRIDTVLDILVAGDYHSAIHNLEILKAELLAQSQQNGEPGEKNRRRPGKYDALASLQTERAERLLPFTPEAVNRRRDGRRIQ